MKSVTRTLPHEGQQLFLTDGGLETTLIFHDGIDLPYFAAVKLLEDDNGTETLRRYYRRYSEIAVGAGTGFVLETPTWRASSDWGALLGYDAAGLAELNRKAVELMREIRDEYESLDRPFVISGNLGPRGDGYVVGDTMTATEAYEYHLPQIQALADAGADQITAITLTYAEEAVGIADAAAAMGLPCIIGFTTETDGSLPNGETLQHAIETVDALADVAPVYYMINCAHVDHFSGALADKTEWTSRIGGIRANASRLSHAELDEAEDLDDGDPQEFGELNARLLERFPHIAVFGGCCGTDHRHVIACGQSLN